MVHAEAAVRESNPLPPVSLTPRPQQHSSAVSSTAVVVAATAQPYSLAAWSPLGVNPRGGHLPRFPMDQWVGKMPGQLADLSCSLCDFGVVPLRGVDRRIVLVRNLTARAIAFSWESTGDALVSFEPRTGIVGPRQKIVCRVTVRASDEPVLLDRNVACMVTYHNEGAATGQELETQQSQQQRNSRQRSAAPLVSRSNYLSTAVTTTLPIGPDDKLNSMSGIYLGKTGAEKEEAVWVGTGQFGVMAPTKSPLVTLSSEPPRTKPLGTERLLMTRTGQAGSPLSGTLTHTRAHPDKHQQTTNNLNGTLNKSRLFAASNQHVKPQEVDLVALLANAESWTLHLRVRAHILYPEQVQLLPDGEDVLQRSYGAPPRLTLADEAPLAAWRSAEARLARATVAEQALLTEVMALLLQDVVAQPTTRATLDTQLVPAPTPFFVHLSAHKDYTQASVHPYADPHVRAKCAEHDLVIPAVPISSSPAAAQSIPSALTAEYQVWGEAVLDGVLFSLLQEAVLGEFNITGALAKKPLP